MKENRYIVYGMTLSGNCHKVKLLLQLTGQPYEWIETDTRQKATHEESFRQKNANTQVPLLQLKDGSYLAESNAILFYLAQGTAYWPEEQIWQARALQWMFFEQYSHEPYIAVNRARLSVFKTATPGDAEMIERHKKGLKALSVMNSHLGQNQFFAGEQVSIADIALFAYTHVAPEGGFDLGEFPAVEEWLGRLALSGFTSMPACT